MEATAQQKQVYGGDVKLDPICGFPIEDGSGAFPLDQQRRLFLQTLPEAQADALRRKLGWPIPSEVAAEAAAKAAAVAAAAKAHQQEAEAALARVPQLEAEIAAADAALHPTTTEEKSDASHSV